MRKYHYGFTLIELVVVIAIIGILAATALPRYINLQTQARIAKAQAIYGSIRSAAALARANCMVDLAGLTTPAACQAGAASATNTTNMDGTSITMAYQYPTADAAGIIAAAQLNAGADNVTITAGNPLLIDINGGTSPNCQISYTAATVTGTGALVAPVITSTTAGC